MKHSYPFVFIIVILTLFSFRATSFPIEAHYKEAYVSAPPILKIHAHQKNNELVFTGEDVKKINWIYIYNISGNLALKSKFTKTPIPTFGLKTGIYYLKVETAEGTLTKRLIVN